MHTHRGWLLLNAPLLQDYGLNCDLNCFAERFRFKRLNSNRKEEEVNEKMPKTFVTTLDNPFDYFTQFDEWYSFDTQKGYNTCSYIARIAKTSNEMSENDYTNAVNEAVDEILRLNITGNYKKVVEGESKVDENKTENEE